MAWGDWEDVSAEQEYWDARARLAQLVGNTPGLTETAQKLFDRAVQEGADPYEALQDVHADTAAATQKMTGGRLKSH